MSSCFFCIPVKYELIIWGYLKLIFSITVMINIIQLYFRQFSTQIECTSWELIITFFSIIITIIDSMFNVILLVAVFLNKRLLYLAYFYYSLLMMSVCPVLFCISLYIFLNPYVEYLIVCVIIPIALCGLVIFFIQVYITVMVRRELKKKIDNADCKSAIN